MLGSLPLLALVVIVYNIVIYLTGFTMDTELFSLSLVSGAVWIVKLGDIFIATALILLFLELVNSTKTGASTIINHALSMLVLLVALVQFIVLPQFGTSVFFIIVLVNLLDVIAGFTVTITSARRDFSVTE
ncbi:MAG: hypothetical protein Q7T44_03205 [Parvibaculum sp.]|nr:hypothetical protein [Parvibaculum sp.]